MSDETDFDVLVCGGGLAGLTFARQLRREIPDARVAVVERVARPLPEAAHKVGESSVELGSRYFEHTLGLREYLHARHLIKNGLRFFPGGGATHAVEDRTEIGPPQLPIVPSFQLDRGRFENDLRGFCEEDGVTLIEGVGVTSLSLADGAGPHRVELSDGRGLTGRWLVDASGRRRLLARELGLGEPSGHEAHAAWFRVEGRLDIDHLVPSSDVAWHGHDPDGIRWLSTSHLMGEGYWVWIIPLSSGNTSIGVVTHGAVHGFETINTLPRALEWMEAHEPVLRRQIAAHLDGRDVADFRCLKSYSYTAKRVFSAGRWACVGEAGLFVDPFYSPGSDFIALANSFTVELIRRDRAGEDIEAHVDYFDWFYRRLGALSTETYKHAAKAYGQPRVLAAKIYWDNFNYWSFVCQYFFQDIFRLGLDGLRSFDEVAEQFATLNLRAQGLFRAWSARANDPPTRRHQLMPAIPSELAKLHIDLQTPMSPDETRAYMQDKAELAEVVLTELLLRAVTELGEREGRALVEELGARDWPLRGFADRVEAEAGGRRGRRKRLSRIARDIERCLGPLSAPEGSTLDVAVAVFPERAPGPMSVAAPS